jgi:pantetheine-phosphate adenylyltransferase
MLKALLPGSFDPPTNGHINLIRRSAIIYDEIHVVIASNPSKKYFFSAEERFKMMESLAKPFENVTVHIWDRLIVEFAKNIGAKIMIRGVRALSDFSYEFELSMINKGLDPEIETIFMPTAPQYFVLRSSQIKELARLHGDISKMVPPIVAAELKRKIEKK